MYRAAAAQAFRWSIVIFQRPEYGEQVIMAPAGIATLAPFVKIFPRTAHIDHGVDRA